MERRLIAPDVSGPQPADAPAGHLGGAPALVALHEPTQPVDLVPAPVAQHPAPEPRPVRIRRRAWVGMVAAGLNVGLALAFWALSKAWTTPPPVETVAVGVAYEPAAQKPEPAAKAETRKPEAPKAEASKPAVPPVRQPPPAPDPPTPPAVQPPPSTATPTAQAPALVAPPPEPTRAKTQTQRDKTPNVEPDDADKAASAQEAKPTEGLDVLSTTNTKAAFAVPPAAELPKPPAPAPEAPRAPTETEKLAAALPSDTSGLPESFRAVLSGKGAEVNGTYGGLVGGVVGRAVQSVGERAYRQNLKGAVRVDFTLGDDGNIVSLSIGRSSGVPALDALALDAIRASAPFPPPPPTANRSFSKMLIFGE